MSIEHFGLSNILTRNIYTIKEAFHMFHRIRDLREDKDLTQSTISKYLNISQRTYSHYENGTRDIPISILIAIADFHQVSIDYLVERTNRKEILY